MHALLKGGPGDGHSVDIADGAKEFHVPVPYFPPQGWNLRTIKHPQWANIFIHQMQRPDTGEWVDYQRFHKAVYVPTGESLDGQHVWHWAKKP